MAEIQINYCGDIIWIEKERLPKYQKELEWLIEQAMFFHSTREEAEKMFYLKILQEEQ